MVQNVQTASETAWKDLMRRELTHFMALPFLSRLLDMELFDAIQEVGKHQRDVELLKESARKDPASLAVGRKPTSTSEDQQRKQQVSALKRKLSDLSHEGEESASLALQKLKS